MKIVTLHIIVLPCKMRNFAASGYCVNVIDLYSLFVKMKFASMYLFFDKCNTCILKPILWYLWKIVFNTFPKFCVSFQDFPNEEDTCYLAHCYPYTFTDLKEDLDSLINAPDRKECMKREVLCETRAGNSCFLVTATNFGKILIHFFFLFLTNWLSVIVD